MVFFKLYAWTFQLVPSSNFMKTGAGKVHVLYFHFSASVFNMLNISYAYVYIVYRPLVIGLQMVAFERYTTRAAAVS